MHVAKAIMSITLLDSVCVALHSHFQNTSKHCLVVFWGLGHKCQPNLMRKRKYFYVLSVQFAQFVCVQSYENVPF